MGEDMLAEHVASIPAELTPDSRLRGVEQGRPLAGPIVEACGGHRKRFFGDFSGLSPSIAVVLQTPMWRSRVAGHPGRTDETHSMM